MILEYVFITHSTNPKEKDVMTESNPVAKAEQSGLVYSTTEQEDTGRFILINLSKSTDPETHESELAVDLSASGLNSEQVLEVLEKLTKQLRADAKAESISA